MYSSPPLIPTILQRGLRFLAATLSLSIVALSSAQAAAAAKILYVHGAAGSQDAGDPDIIRLLTSEL